MKFDESKVFTALNADGLKKGDKVITAYGLITLKSFIIADYTSEELLDIIEKVQLIKSDGFENRIVTEVGNFPFAYLVERKGEKHFRPYKDTDEMIADCKKRFSVDCPEYEIPSIWVKNKSSLLRSQVTDFNTDYIWLSNIQMFFRSLFDDYIYLDGSPCGMEE